MSRIAILLFMLLPACVSAQYVGWRTPARQAHEDSIVNTYLREGAWKHSYLSPQWQEWVDKGIAADSTIAYLWQQKGMPLWKTRKYELATAATERAVGYDSIQWIDYLAYCKCIFSKDHRSALRDFAAARRIKPGGYVMDHSYPFYESLCYLQLNRYDSALTVLKREIERGEAEKGASWTHYLDMMYMGIAYYECGDDVKAIGWFDKALERYPRFSDVKYYKGRALIRSNREEEGRALMREGKKDFEAGNTINEDNVIYEPYPYQVKWQWNSVK